MMKKPLFLILLITILLNSFNGSFGQTKVSLPTVFGDNMVLQRDKPIQIWGWSAPEELITITFGDKKTATKANAKGKWQTTLAAMPANAKPTSLTIRGSNEIILKNIVVGDVWVCSGQSNMEFNVRGSLQAKTESASAKFPLIRHIKIRRQAADAPQTHFQGKWVICSPKTVGTFTAVGYFFGRRLHQDLNVPIGLINTSWGGTRIEPWIPPTGFKKINDQTFAIKINKRLESCDPKTAIGKSNYHKAITDIEAWVEKARADTNAGIRPSSPPEIPSMGKSYQDPTRLFQGMVAPFIPFAIRGAIWYQGEANGTEGMTYYHKKRALVEGWRTQWGQGDFPFYWVQLANYRNDRRKPKGGDGYAKIRGAQRMALDIPNTGMAVIIDIGSSKSIHPKNKQDVGTRLALWALSNEYGKKIVYSGPLYKSYKIESNKIRIIFDHVAGGLIVGKKEGLAPTQIIPDGKLKRFAIAGADKKWVWAEAVIDGADVIVSSPEVPKPVAIRYAFTTNPVGANLYNKEGLPASPFRTDNWK